MRGVGCQTDAEILHSKCETSDPHSYSAHSILQKSTSRFPLSVANALARSTFPLSVFMTDRSGYSVTTTKEGRLPLGNVAASKDGRALPAPSSMTNRTNQLRDGLQVCA